MDTRIRGKGGKIISDLMALSDVNDLLEIVSISDVGYGKVLGMLRCRYPTCWLFLGIVLCEVGSEMLYCN